MMTLSVQAVHWAAVAPVAITAAAALIVLLAQALWPGRRRLLDGLTLGGLALAGVSLLPLVGGGRQPTFCSPGGCSFEAGGPLIGLQVIVLVSAGVVGLLSIGSRSLAADEESSVADTAVEVRAGARPGSATGEPVGSGSAQIAPAPVAATVLPVAPVRTGRAVRAAAGQRPGTLARSEYWSLLLMATAGSLALVASRDLLTMLIALETATLPVIGLAGVQRTREAAGAAIRLLLVAVVSFGLALFGVALLYAGAGTVYLDALLAGASSATGSPALALLGVALLVAGVGYKVAALPFGFWVADVYPAVPLPVATYLSTVSKVAGVAALALVIGQALPGTGGQWLAVVIAVTMTLANLVALTRASAISILAWSTIAQAGWALLPLASGGPRGVVQGAVTTYLLAYCAASVAAFTTVLLVGRHHDSGRRHLIRDQAGLIRTEPVAASILVLALLSLAGLPPGLAGLVAKIAVLRPVVEAGDWWLAVVAAVNVAIGLAYYLRWVWTVLAPADRPAPTWRVRPAEGVALSLAAAVLLVFTLLPGTMT